MHFGIFCSLQSLLFRTVWKKNVNTATEILSLGRHAWRCTAKLYTQYSQITGNHGDQNNEQIQSIENSSRSLVNLNDQHSLNAPEGTLTEYDEKM